MKKIIKKVLLFVVVAQLNVTSILLPMLSEAEKKAMKKYRDTHKHIIAKINEKQRKKQKQIKLNKSKENINRMRAILGWKKL